MKSITFNEERCRGCELCAVVCPKKAISLDKGKINQKGYHPASVQNTDVCTGCGQCYVICPHVAIKIEK